MHIGIDGGCWNNRRGYGRFLRELLTALARNDRRNDYTLFLDCEGSQTFEGSDTFRVRGVETQQGVNLAATANARRSTADVLRMSKAVAREKLDLFFFPSVFSYFPLLRRIPMIVGIHDTIAERNARLTFDSRRQELFWRMKVRLALLQASAILTVSEYSKRCVQQWLHVRADRIWVLYEAASPCFVPDGEAVNKEKYILYVGGISPTKNLPLLIRAFAHSMARRSHKLVLVGDYIKDGFKSCYAELSALIETLGLRDDVTFTGFVPDDELGRLYRGATVLVMPSLDEGFGLPAMEAMACGTPTIVSAGNAMEEIVADAGCCIKGSDARSWAEQIDRIVKDPPLACELRKRGLQRARQFSWDRTACGLLDIFEDTVKICRTSK